MEKIPKVLELKKPLITFNGFSLKLNRFSFSRWSEKTQQIAALVTRVFKLEFTWQRFVALLLVCILYIQPIQTIQRSIAMPKSENRLRICICIPGENVVGCVSMSSTVWGCVCRPTWSHGYFNLHHFTFSILLLVTALCQDMSAGGCVYLSVEIDIA